MTTSLDTFRQVLHGAGLTAVSELIPGRVVRFAGVGKSNGNKSGWAWLAEDGEGGAFGDWATGLNEKWHAHNGHVLTADERIAETKRISACQQIRDEEKAKAQTMAAQRARSIWEQATPAPATHAYLVRKQIRPHGLRIDASGRLLVPVMIDGSLASLQVIDTDGHKEFLAGAKTRGGRFILGELGETVVLCEGFATGASLHEASGLPVVVAFSANNLAKVGSALRDECPAATILVAGDNDHHADGRPNVGLDAATATAEAIRGTLLMPEVLHDHPTDWNDVAIERGLEAVREALAPSDEEQVPDFSFPASPSLNHGGLPETRCRPVRASDLLSEVQVPVEWILEDYLPLGALALIAGKPKEGKTTLLYELAVKVAKGETFLGRTTRQSGVFILAVEEHRRDVKSRLQHLGVAGLDNLFVHVGPLDPTPTFFAGLLTFLKTHQIGLLIIDTLAAFWSVENENDASEMTRAVKPLLELARASNTCVLLIHHARKSEGSHGDEIRGSGALFGLVDMAIVMKRHAVETQRLLQAQSRYPETPSELVIELRESGYVALGDPASVGKVDKLKRIRAVVTEVAEETDVLAKRAELSRRDACRLLEQLASLGEVVRQGKGRRNDPHRYARLDTGTPPSQGVGPARNETRQGTTSLYAEASCKSS